MKSPNITIHGRDIVAVIIIGLLFACKLMGMNGLIDSAIALVVGYYFSKRVYEETNNGNKK